MMGRAAPPGRRRALKENVKTTVDIAREVLGQYRETDTEGWDLHSFFELIAGDDQAQREAVFDVVERLAEEGYLESRGGDFYTLTGKGLQAARHGDLDGW
jgi:hypothetical protein